MSRLQMTVKNILATHLSNMLTLLAGFAMRTIFIYILGPTYLGVNGLFTNVLGVLSFADLGFGTAMNFSLYKPVAQGDTETIKSLMHFYKKVYRVVALIIAVIGVLLIPFLPYIIKGGESVGYDKIPTYYCIFLFNTVSSYFVSYKYSLVNADQKFYIVANINTVVNLLIIGLQIAGLLIFKNFLLYLLTASIVGLLRIVLVNYYVDKMYPYLKDKDVKPIEKETLAPILRNVKALVWHKFGEVTINQTDNILISSFLSVTMTGIVSNYTLLINSVDAFVSSIFNSAMGSIGNLVASTDQKHQFNVFCRYRFLNMWMFGFSSLMFFLMLSPFVTLWIGADKVIDSLSLLLICVNYYFLGQRNAFLNFKTGFGTFYDDQYVPLIAGVCNLIISVVACKLIGLPGIYVGTLATGLFQSISRPIIAYRKIFNQSVAIYFVDLFAKFVVLMGLGILCQYVNGLIGPQLSWGRLFACTAIDCVLINAGLAIIYWKTSELQYYWGLVCKIIHKK